MFFASIDVDNGNMNCSFLPFFFFFPEALQIAGVSFVFVYLNPIVITLHSNAIDTLLIFHDANKF